MTAPQDINPKPVLRKIARQYVELAKEGATHAETNPQFRGQENAFLKAALSVHHSFLETGVSVLTEAELENPYLLLDEACEFCGNDCYLEGGCGFTL